MKKFLFPPPYLQDQGLAIIRIVTGLFLVYHGWEVFDQEKMKGYLTWDQFKTPNASFIVHLGKAMEFIAGILLSLGLFTRVTSLVIAGTMLYISFFVGTGKIWYEDQHPFLFVLLALVFFFAGPGKYSLDNFFFNKQTAS